MGVPKQKWTGEEEAALKAGVHKHGPGKWQIILKDPEFEIILQSRSNVDLKDKWRNINVTLSGLGSREKVRLALMLNPQFPRLEDNVTVVNNPQIEDKVAEAKPVACNETAEVLLSTYVEKTSPRLDNVILEAIATLKEPKGSDRSTIAMFMKERYGAPPSYSVLLNSLKSLTASGQLSKVKHKYMIPTSLPSSETRSSSPSDRLIDHPRSLRKELKIFTRPDVVADLERMNCLTAQAAASAAAQAVAKAEAAIAEAEKAARDAESAEAEADAARVFAEAAMKALSYQKLRAC